MLMVMLSPDGLLKNGQPDSEVAKVLIESAASGNPVALVSNRDFPAWAQQMFQGSKVKLFRSPGRQSGEVVLKNAAILKLQAFDTIVLAAKVEDVQMGKNGGAVLVAAGSCQHTTHLQTWDPG